MNKQTVRDVDLTGKRVLVRVDFNVPLDGDRVTDDTRVRAAIPTLKYILEQNPRYIALMSHLGRPKGEPKPEFSLRPVVPVLADLLGTDVAFAEDCVGEAAKKAAEALPEGGVLLLENTRFHAEETKNNEDFARAARRAGRHLRERRIWLGTPRPRLDRRRHASSASRERLSDGKRAGLSGQRSRVAGTPVCGDPGRRQSVGQDRRDRVAALRSATGC